MLETASILGWFHAGVGAMNLAAAVRSWRRGRAGAVVWLAVAGVAGTLATLAFAGRPPGLPARVREGFDALLGPVTFTLGSLALLTVALVLRRFVARGAVGWTLLNLSLAWLGLSLADPEFAATVSKPDNVPIVAMVYLLGFFTWVGLRQAVINDERLARGAPPVEAEHADNVLVWPDVIYLELIGAVLCTVALIVWSLLLTAPLEEPANPAVTPNPSKAPWYFLGLQEMLVYFAPSMAGVILPALIIVGLMAIPYLDPNPKGSGYYTFRERPFAWVVFLFGFLQLWVLLILIGTFLRGPNWGFVGLYEAHDIHASATATNRTLAELFWVDLLGRTLPGAGDSPAAWFKVILRELPGLTLLAGYFVALPLWLARTRMRDFRRSMGRARYWIMVLLLLAMLALPLKMLLNWTIHLSYIVAMPEYFIHF